MTKRFSRQVRPLFVFLLTIVLFWPESAGAYAVLSHEAIIDAAWERHIKPLLLKKYPQATEEALSRAQAYAYGGSIIQDMGYYPFGSPFFRDLTHYVRSGDFIQDRKSTRLNSSHGYISYAVFCLQKKITCEP